LRYGRATEKENSMKTFFALVLIATGTCSFAASGWKVVAETKDCADTVQVLAKEGEKYVIAREGKQETKLYSKEKAVFSSTNGEPLVFSADKYTFTQPRMVEAAQPKLEVAHNGLKSTCLMTEK
jgi:hypothetical protein